MIGFIRGVAYASFTAWVGLAGHAWADDDFDALLAARRFETAIAKADLHVDRDELLGKIALAQFQANEVPESKSTLRRITDVASLATATRAIGAAKGGATGADFDTLINLITSTVEPNSWDDVGGPGAIEEFPGGVFVDSAGVLRQVNQLSDSRARSLRSVREMASKKSDNHNVGRPSDLRMVSLARLQRELQLKGAFGEPPTEAMKRLAGLREIQYVFLYPDQNDCVLAGPATDWNNPNGSTLLLDDLVTLLRVAQQQDGRFGCSIVPKQTGLAATQHFLSKPTGRLTPNRTRRWVNDIRDTLGLQDIQIYGVDPGSHAARVLVAADYHMKLIGMGIEPGIPEVPSYLESIEPDQLPKSMDVLRWWFTVLPKAIQRTEDGLSFVFSNQIVGLKSENELLTDRGERIHTGESSEQNQMFAARFTEHFRRLSQRHSVYRQLENLFRLSIVAALIHDEQVLSHIDWDASWLVQHVSSAAGQAPKEVPSIVNYRTVNRRHVVVGVSGGVVMNAREAIREVTLVTADGTAISTHSSARPRDPVTSARWWWD